MNVKIKIHPSVSSIVGLFFIFAVFKFSAFGADEPSGLPGSEPQVALQKLIDQQSGGRIKITSFANTGSMGHNTIMEVNGEKIHPVVFTAKLKVVGPCKWAFRFEGRPLTFNTYNSDDTNAPISKDVIEISPAGETFTLNGVALFSLNRTWRAVGVIGPIQPKRPADELSDQCVNQLTRIGIAFNIWARDHNYKYPFNLSTNAGGTKEICVPSKDGFDANAAMHFKIMSNGLSAPKILVCPADSSKSPATNFSGMKEENVSYLLHTEPDVDESHPEAILARCPIHGHTLYCDGHIERGGQKLGGENFYSPTR